MTATITATLTHRITMGSGLTASVVLNEDNSLKSVKIENVKNKYRLELLKNDTADLKELLEECLKLCNIG